MTLNYQKFYICLSHNFLIIVIISKPNFNRLSFKFTTQVSLFTTDKWIIGLFGYESVWVRLHLSPFSGVFGTNNTEEHCPSLSTNDDFAEFTPPASKRIKTSTSKTEAKSKEPKTNKTKEGRGDRKSLNRPAPTDEAFDSELQLALEMSRSESQEVKEAIPLVESNKENQQQVEVEDEKAEEEPDVSSNILEKTDMTPEVPSNICNINSKRESHCKPATVMNKSDDEIEVLATDVIEDVKPRRSSATKKVKKQEESDFEDDMEDISSYDEEDDGDDSYNGEDSDFDDCKKKTKSKAKKSVKSTTATKAKAATGKATKPASSKPASKSSASKSSVKPVGAKSPSAARPLASRPSPVRRPTLSSPSTRWNPPGPAKQKNSDATTIQSPTSGLRLGLSRNMKLKPLHPNLKVQH